MTGFSGAWGWVAACVCSQNAIARKRNDGSNVRREHKPGQNLSLLSTNQSP
jgi:hypothetical protein